MKINLIFRDDMLATCIETIMITTRIIEHIHIQCR